MQACKQVILAMSLGLTSMMALADQHHSPANTITTVKQAFTANDDTPVRLTGYIVKAMGDEKYQFRDDTGLITVDIDTDKLQGQSLSAKNKITIYGEVDIEHKPRKQVEIEVDQIKF